ncbi:hypothetical protein EDD86DRAFT_247169 [Gorgonomyces haynaldii]|nr:hypothetical protein EDD86DRAFT_247169 [Gorgonomyces haynaldii]
MSLPSYSLDRFDGYKELSLGLCEFAVVAFHLFQKYDSDKKVIKTPLFRIAVGAVVSSGIVLACYMFSLWYLDQNYPYSHPWRHGYHMLLAVLFVISMFPAILIHIMLLIRMRGFGGVRSRPFIVTSVLCAAHLIVFLGSSYLGIICVIVTDGFFYNAPQYELWMSSAGLCIFLDAFINLSSSFLFLREICIALELDVYHTMKELVKKHHGVHWIGMILVNTNFVVTVIYSVFRKNSRNYITANFHLSPYMNLISLYCFVDASYFLAREMITKHSKASQQMIVTTKN